MYPKLNYYAILIISKRLVERKNFRNVNITEQLLAGRIQLDVLIQHFAGIHCQRVQ